MNDLLDSLKRILEDDEKISIWFEDDRMSLSIMVNNYDVRLSSDGIEIEFDWTNIFIKLDDIIKAMPNEVLNGYDLIGENWRMCLHTSGAF